MVKRWMALLIGSLVAFSAFAQNSEMRFIKPFGIAAGGDVSYVFTPTSLSDLGVQLPSGEGVSFDLIFKPTRSAHVDSLYGHPYFGVGFYKPYYHESELLGNPYSIYLLYGQNLYTFNRRVALGAETLIGGSFGWTPYDHETNPLNRIVGAKNNYHASGRVFIRYHASKSLTFKAGTVFTHNSDGSYKLPNTGFNSLGAYAQVMYNFGNDNLTPLGKANIPQFTNHFETDLELSYGARQVRRRASNIGLNGIVNHSFRVYTAGVAAMFTGAPFLRVGLGTKLIYDESLGITVNATYDKLTNTAEYKFTPSEVGDRFVAGVFGRIEVPMGYISAFYDLAYLFGLNSTSDNVVSMNLGVKAYIYKGLNLKFGVQLIPEQKANCTELTLGYTLFKR